MMLNTFTKSRIITQLPLVRKLLLAINLLFLSALFLSSLSACTSLVDATTSAPIKHDPGKRSFGTYMDDKKIATTIKVNLRKTAPGLAQSHINVHAFNGVVLLTGEVPSKELREQAANIARESHLVRQVHNELLIQGNPTVFSHANDKWLYTKIRSQLIADKVIDSSRIKVVVENRIVYLMGLLTRDNTQRITEIAANTSGIEKVVRVIEYID